VSTRKHYSRAWRGLSGAVRAVALLSCAWAGVCVAAWGQYPGQVQTQAKEPVLRAVAVFEWTGDLKKPTFSRLVPVTIFDGQTLQDGGIYLARPAPLGLDTGTEYVLEKNGERIGLFDIDAAGQQRGIWMGFGKQKPMPKLKPQERNPQFAKVDYDDASSDKPILHRKHHPDDATKAGGGAGPARSAAPAPDPDRPTLTREGQSADAANAPAPDPDRPVLMEPKKQKKAAANDVAYVSDLPDITDPGRPRLMRGKPNDAGAVESPELKGLPPAIHQMVAVSDAATRPVHVWNYTWSDPADAVKMKQELEGIARDALGLTPPPAKPQPKGKKTRRTARPVVTQLTLPAELHDEDFRVFELAYGSTATMVFSADTGGALHDEKFVTLIAQPDLYGNVAVLLKHVSDGAHLDDSPRMRLVDAVDAMADNRGELLFELRGESGRQFVLYRVLRGQAERIFASTPEWFGTGLDGAGADGSGSAGDE
ncbi:MAG TPA: hypothetical protein VFU68_03005, partial [Terracidiphilus sp.]|nr:hypothetical protein [Terracidiphilus sp.]